MAVIHSLFRSPPVASSLPVNRISANANNAGTVDPSPKSETNDSSKSDAAGSGNESVEALSSQDQQLVAQLKSSDKRVKAHELAHLLAAGDYARGGPSYQYRQGPDGKKYAVAGEVQIDSGKESVPEKTISKMKIVQRAALAPADPSPQDRRVAAKAGQNIAEASQEIRIEVIADKNVATKEDVTGNKDKSTDSSGSDGLSYPAGKGSTPYASSTLSRFVNPPTLDVFA